MTEAAEYKSSQLSQGEKQYPKPECHANAPPSVTIITLFCTFIQWKHNKVLPGHQVRLCDVQISISAHIDYGQMGAFFHSFSCLTPFFFSLALGSATVWQPFLSLSFSLTSCFGPLYIIMFKT